MEDKSTGRGAQPAEIDISRLHGGLSLGTVYSQKFYAVRAGGGELQFPFPEQSFTALIDIAGPVSDEALQMYAQRLTGHGCVQAVCRGESSDRLAVIFDNLSEQGGLDRDGIPFTCMCTDDDETLTEAIEYFVTPTGLAQTGLLMVIGGSDDFDNAVQCFLDAAGAHCEGLSEPEYLDADMVCFDGGRHLYQI